MAQHLDMTFGGPWGYQHQNVKHRRTSISVENLSQICLAYNSNIAVTLS